MNGLCDWEFSFVECLSQSEVKNNKEQLNSENTANKKRIKSKLFQSGDFTIVHLGKYYFDVQ